MSGDVTSSQSARATQLAGTPVGDFGGDLNCECCGAELSDGGRRSDPDGALPSDVFVLAEQPLASDTCFIKGVRCHDCGPHEPTSPSEFVATATLTYKRRVGAFALANPEIRQGPSPGAGEYPPETCFLPSGG